jgi:hypothetical protein
MTNDSPTDPGETFAQPIEERLPRSLSRYWASDRDETGELMQEQEILTEQALHLAEQQEHDRQEAFAQLNPDFGVLPDSRDPGQHRFAQQRERALALGERVAAAELSGRERGEPSDIFYFPRLPATSRPPTERATDQREQTRQRLLESYQRRQAAREQRSSARPSRSTATRTPLADQERDR